MSLKNIEAHLDEKGFLVVNRLPCINHGENVSVGIRVSADNNFFSKQPSTVNYFFEFKSADGQKQISPPVQVVDDVLTCVIKNSVLCCPGEAQVQVVATDESGYVFKSSVATFFVAQSINAVDQDFEVADLLTQINKLFNQTHDIKNQAEQTQQQMQNLIDLVNQKLANGDFVGAKGDKGDVPTMYIQNGMLYAEFDEEGV